MRPARWRLTSRCRCASTTPRSSRVTATSCISSFATSSTTPSATRRRGGESSSTSRLRTRPGRSESRTRDRDPCRRSAANLRAAVPARVRLRPGRGRPRPRHRARDRPCARRHDHGRLDPGRGTTIRDTAAGGGPDAGRKPVPLTSQAAFRSRSPYWWDAVDRALSLAVSAVAPAWSPPAVDPAEARHHPVSGAKSRAGGTPGPSQSGGGTSGPASSGGGALVPRRRPRRGDIPDNQVFLVPRQGRPATRSSTRRAGRSRATATVTFRDKDNVVRIEVVRPRPPTVASVAAGRLRPDIAAGQAPRRHPTCTFQSSTRTARSGGQGRLLRRRARRTRSPASA